GRGRAALGLVRRPPPGALARRRGIPRKRERPEPDAERRRGGFHHGLRPGGSGGSGRARAPAGKRAQRCAEGRFHRQREFRRHSLQRRAQGRRDARRELPARPRGSGARAGHKNARQLLSARSRKARRGGECRVRRPSHLARASVECRTRPRPERTPSRLDDPDRRGMGAALHRMRTTEGRTLRLLVLGLVAVGLVFPIVAGLWETGRAAFGLLPAIGAEQPTLAPWREFMTLPGAGTSVVLTLWTGVASTALSLAFALGIAGAVHGRVRAGRMAQVLTPFLATPHAAMAIGTAFLIAPS